MTRFLTAYQLRPNSTLAQAGELPTRVITTRPRTKRVSFSGFGYMRGYGFYPVEIYGKIRGICHFGL